MTQPRLAWTEARGRAAVAERSQGRCEVCGRHRATSWAHRQRRSAGGTWHPATGLHACGDGTRGCEGFITAHRDPITGQPADVFHLGLQVRQGDHPASVVARLIHGVYGPGWYDLAAGDDGTGLRLVKPWQPPRVGELLPTRKWTRVVRA